MPSSGGNNNNLLNATLVSWEKGSAARFTNLPRTGWGLRTYSRPTKRQATHLVPKAAHHHETEWPSESPVPAKMENPAWLGSRANASISSDWWTGWSLRPVDFTRVVPSRAIMKRCQRSGSLSISAVLNMMRCQLFPASPEPNYFGTWSYTASIQTMRDCVLRFISLPVYGIALEQLKLRQE